MHEDIGSPNQESLRILHPLLDEDRTRAVLQIKLNMIRTLYLPLLNETPFFDLEPIGGNSATRGLNYCKQVFFNVMGARMSSREVPQCTLRGIAGIIRANRVGNCQEKAYVAAYLASRLPLARQVVIIYLTPEPGKDDGHALVWVSTMEKHELDLPKVINIQTDGVWQLGLPRQSGGKLYGDLTQQQAESIFFVDAWGLGGGADIGAGQYTADFPDDWGSPGVGVRKEVFAITDKGYDHGTASCQRPEPPTEMVKTTCSGCDTVCCSGPCKHPDAIGDYVPKVIRANSPEEIAEVAGCRAVAGIHATRTTMKSLAGLESIEEVRIEPSLDEGVEVSGSVLIGGPIGGGGMIESTAGLSGLKRVARKVSVSDSDKIKTVTFPALETVSAFRLTGLDNLETVDAPKLRRAPEAVSFFDAAPQAVNLPALVSTGRLSFSLVGELTTISAPKLSRIGGHFILDAINLETLSVPKLREIQGALKVNTCWKLPTLDLGKVTTTMSGIHITNNKTLSHFALGGAPATQAVSDPNEIGNGDLFIKNNPLLGSFDLSSLTRVDADFVFEDNDVLPTSDIETLQMQVEMAGGIGGSVIIDDNL